MKYEFTTQQIRNFLSFLGRTTLNGKEVNAYNEIIIALSRPIKEDPEESEDKKDETSSDTSIEGADS